MDSISPFGRRTANKYIGRTLDGNRAAPLDTVRFPVYLFTKIGKNNRAVPGTRAGSLYATLRVFNGLFTANRFDENACKIWSSLFDTPGPVRVLKIVPAPVETEGGQPGIV